MASPLLLLRRCERKSDHKRKLHVRHFAAASLCSLSLLAALLFLSDLPLQKLRAAFSANGSPPSSISAPKLAPKLQDVISADGSPPFPSSSSPSPLAATLGSGSPPPELQDAAISADGSSPSPEVAILGNGSTPAKLEDGAISADGLSPSSKVAILGSGSTPPELEEAVISADELLPSPRIAILGNGSMPFEPKDVAISADGSSPSPEVGGGSLLVTPLARSPVQSPAEHKDTIFANGSTSSSHLVVRSPVAPVLGNARGGGTCDLYSGRWVKDVEGRYPLYLPGKCPFVDQAFACQENGRRDAEYLKWRWKPHGCDLPRFNATDFLERLRGKVMMLVGDSMSRNQFGSLLCLLREALPVKNRMYEKRGYKISRDRGYYQVHLPDYNCSVKYQSSRYLVSKGTRLDARGKKWPTLRLDTIDEFASSRWRTADVLIFNTGHWWNQEKTFSGKNFYQEGSTVHPRLGPVKAFRRTLRTWAAWVEENLTSRENAVFFRGLGASHYRGGEWYSGGTCNKETEPVFRGRVLEEYPWKMKVIEEVVRRMRFPVTFMNVTKLTNYRKDAHPSMYGGVWTVPGAAASERKEDCSHWCLPGVPDTWNELLYAHLVLRG